MQVKPFTYDSASSTLYLHLTFLWLATPMKMTILQRPLVFFFQHSTIAKQCHGLSAYGTLAGKGLRYLYLQRFRNFLNLRLELDLDLEFILKIFLAINISDLFDCYCIILALPTLVSVVPLQVDTVFPFPRLWQHDIVRVTLLIHAFLLAHIFSHFKTFQIPATNTV